MKTRLLLIITLVFSVFLFTQSTYAECSEQDRDACIDSDGKFDYDAYEDSFWEPIEIQYSFEKNSTATFEHKKDELGLRGMINASQEDVITMTVPRSIVDAIHRNCDPNEILLLAKYDNANTTSYDNFYQESFLAEQIMNQTHRVVTFKVLPTMSFELIGMFPLGLVDEMHNTCGALNGYKTYYAPPKFQLEHNVEPIKIKCNDELVLLHKYDGSPSCVTEQTKQKLIERGWTEKNDSTLPKINTSCMTLEQSKETAPFFKTPSYLPEGYSYVCSRSGMPFESYIVYYNQEFPNNWQIHELVSEGAIFIYQIDERNFVDEKEYATYGSPEQRTRETYDSVIEGNPSLNPQLITINGMLAYAVDSCSDCGKQTANFTDGTSIQKSTSTETKIKFIDENGVKYMLKTTLPLSELIKVAESLQ